MSKKVINLGKVKGRTLDLKVEDNIIKKKYDDEAEWVELGKVGGIDTVDTVNDLPVDAEKDDIAFVKEAAFVETVEYQEEVPIIIQNSEQIFNIELKQDPTYLLDIDLKEKHPELTDEYAAMIIMFDFKPSYSDRDIREIQYFHISSSTVSAMFDVNHSINIYDFTTFNPDESMTRWIKLRGMSIKDYLTMIVGIEIDDEQLQILLGEHYADNTTDNPSYGWIKFNGTSEPLNENSIAIEGIYATIEFDAIADFKLTGAFTGIDIRTTDTDGDDIFYFEFDSQDSEDYEPEKITTAFGYANTFVNLLFSGGTKDASYDVYSKKGFHKFDEKWKSLEEEMNIPKVVEKHSDLPKSFIENGIMVVANEETILPEPTTKLEASVPVSVKVNPTPSVKDEVEKFKEWCVQNSIVSDVDWDNCYIYFRGDFMNEDEDCIAYFRLHSDMTDNGVYGIELNIPTPEDTRLKYLYFDEGGADIYIPGVDQYSDGTIYTTDEGGWYCMEVYLNSKDEEFLKTPIKKVEFEDEFDLSDGMVTCYMVGMYEDDNGNYDEFEEISYEFAGLFRVYDESKKIVYPKGFYMYAKNHWWHQPGIAGESFDNVDVLRTITAEDVGNFHSHNNQNYLDKITNDEYIHSHNNKSVLDNLSYKFIANIAKRDAHNTYEKKRVLSEIYVPLRLSYTCFTDIYLAYDHINIDLDGYTTQAYGIPIEYIIPEYSFAISVDCPSEYAEVNIYSTTSSSPYDEVPIIYVGYANGEKPVFEKGYRYEFSVLNGVAAVGRTPLQEE